MKKPKTLMAILVGLLLTTLLISGCQTILVTRSGDTETGETETRQFDFSEFTHVDIGSAFSYEIKQSDIYSISITANDNLFDDIKVTKEGQTLKIEREVPEVPWAIFNIGSDSPKAIITMPQLYSLDSSGASRGKAKGFKSSHDFDLLLSGASTLDMDMETGNVEFEISGASEVTGQLEAWDARIELSGASTLDMEGSAGNTVLRASGASEAALSSFTVNDADIQLSGASDAIIYINGRLDVNLSGASTLEYIGEPTLGKMDITGASTLKKK